MFLPTWLNNCLKKTRTRYIIPDCSEELFEEIAQANPHTRMNLIEGQLEIMPVLEETGM